MKNKKTTVKKRVSTKARLLKIYEDIAIANRLQLELQEKLYNTGKVKELLHESAMVGHFIAECRQKIEKALK